MENLTAKEFCGKVFNSCVKHLTIICMHCWNVNKSCSGLLFYQHPVHIFLSPDISRKSAWVWESAVRCSCLFKFSLLFAKTAFWWYIYRIYSCISRPAYKPVAAIGDERVPWICALSPHAACANPHYGAARWRTRTHVDVRRCVHLPQCKPPHWYADTAAAVCVWSCTRQTAGAY